MSDEEKKAIENLKEVVDLYNDECLITTDYDFKSIETLLNLIDNQQKEIEKLKSKKYILNVETKEIKEIPISDDYISKDKIREKIKKYDKWIKEDGEYVESLEAQRYALNELLEEE